MTEYVRDEFTRTAGATWGTAPTGGLWSEALVNATSAIGGGGTWGRISFLSTGASQADMRLAAATTSLDAMGAVAFVIRPDWLTAGTWSGTSVWQLLRASGPTATPTAYYARCLVQNSGTIRLSIGRMAAGAITEIAAQTFTAATLGATETWHFEVQAVGATATKLQARIWKQGGAVPPGSMGWLIGADDLGPSTAGVYALRLERGAAPAGVTGQTVDVLDYYVTDPPVPTFTYTATGLAATFATTGTTGDFTAYSWSWGDGTAAGSGATPSHTYAAAGTWLVKLTATTRWGATFTGQRSVTVAAPLPAPPELIPTIRINGVDVCDDVYSITWNIGRDTWAGQLAGQTCSLRLRGQYPALQGMPVTIAVPAAVSGVPLWAGMVDQVSETVDPISARSETLVIAMDTASFLGRWHLEPQTILPAVSGLPARLADLRPMNWINYRAKWAGVPGSRFPSLKKKTQAADKLRDRTYLELVSDALAASIAFAYVGRDGDIWYAPWDAPAGVSSTPYVNVDTGADCASRVVLDRNSYEGMINRWTVGSGDQLDVLRRTSIETYGERAFTCPADTLGSDTGLPITDAMTLAMADPLRGAQAEIPVTDWTQKAITVEPLDLALCRGTLMAVMGVRHEITLGDVWRTTLQLDRNPWAIDGRTPP